ncbi:MAG: DUF2194 domain-containing protein [Arenicellales bacterium]
MARRCSPRPICPNQDDTRNRCVTALQRDSKIVEQRLLIVADSRDDYIPGLVMQLGISLRYSKLAADTFDLSTADPLPTLSHYSSVLFLSPAPEEFLQKSLHDLLVYVQHGGSLTFLAPTMSIGARELLGIVAATPYDSPLTDSREPDDEVHKIYFTGDRFQGLQDTTVSFHDVTNKLPLKLTLSSDATVDAYFENFDSLQPAIWHRAVGSGEIAVWTFVPTGRHWGRSFLLHAAIQGQVVAVKSIANTAVFQIDDFPAPPSDDSVPVEPGVDLEWPEFVDRVWLPDLATLADKNRMAYSCGVVFHYDKHTQGPFEFDDWVLHPEDCDKAGFGAAANHVRWAREHGELGLHGYNHLPLALGDWSSREDMVEGLRACVAWWQREATADLPTSYIPPMNVYDQEGALALTEACPTIRALCGNFWGPVSMGGGREFAPERWNRKLFCLPRVTSGYTMDASLKWKMLASIYELGTWTHFIHPDDILDVPSGNGSDEYCRNPQSRPWREPNGLRKELECMLDFVRTTFPWLTFDTATDAATKISGHLNNNFRCRFSERQVIVDSDHASHVMVITRGSPQGISSIDNSAELLNTDKTPGRTNYTIRILPGCTTVTFSS